MNGTFNGRLISASDEVKPMSRSLLLAVLFGAAISMTAGAQPGASPAQRIAVTVDAVKTGPPISPYLYGQFIEHIADTVNRSLWAEMVDDRKFFHDINSKPAPPPRG